MSETVANSRDAFQYITGLIDDTVTSAKQLLETLEREAAHKSSTGHEVILHGDASATQPNPIGQTYLNETIPHLGTRVRCDMYRSLDKRRVLITQVYEAQQEINDEVARELERSAQSLTRKCVVGGDDLVRV